jgi:hypothetical protein
VFTRQPSQAMNKRLLMLFEIFSRGDSRQKNVKQNSQMGQKKFFLYIFTLARGSGRKKRSQKFNKAEHESNFVCTKIIINILCCKFDLTAKIFKFHNENAHKLFFANSQRRNYSLNRGETEGKFQISLLPPTKVIKVEAIKTYVLHQIQ